MGTWWTEHPDLDGVARRGRAEYEDETAAAEADTEQLRRRRRSLIDVCFEWMSRGDLVTASVGGTRFEGRITTAVNDLLVIATKTLEAGLNISSVGFVRSEHRGQFEGTTGNRDVSSFRAYLGRFEVEGTPVRLVATEDSFDVTLTITASTDDHLFGLDAQGREWVLPRRNTGFAVAAREA